MKKDKDKTRHSLPSRSKTYGVGKSIGGCIYIHRQYESVFGEILLRAKNHISENLEYTVVKFNRLTGAVSFINSPDFDTAHEPTVGQVLTVRSDGTVAKRKQLNDPYIYHHKWLFVRDDYEGFDVEQSKDRSRRLLAMSDVDRKRIGKQSYWVTHVLPRVHQ